MGSATDRWLRSRYNGGVSFLIRDFKNGEFEMLWEIDQVCFDPELAYSRPELAFYMRRPSAFTLVAEGTAQDGAEERIQTQTRGDGGNGVKVPGGKVLGFIVAEKRRQTGHIITIDVIEDARRLGVGSRLLEAAENRLLESGATSVELETAVNNDGAIRFYKQRDYFVEGTIRGYYSNQLDALVMKKELSRGSERKEQVRRIR